MGRSGWVGLLVVVLGTLLWANGDNPKTAPPAGPNLHRDAPRALDHLQPAPHLVQRLGYNLRKAYYQSQGFKSADIARLIGPPPDVAGLPTTGTVHIPVLVISFPDQAAVHTEAEVGLNCNGPGNIQAYPYESLAEYYQRSSYNQLNLVFDVYYGYQAPSNRSVYAADNAPFTSDPDAVCPTFDSDAMEVVRRTLITGAVLYYDTEATDFSQYDNNNDGVIDKLIILWAGPTDTNGGFWWHWSVRACATWGALVDGKHLKDYVWSAEESLGNYQSSLNNNALIHELGHALGLPDYYDLDQNIGPDGGLGQLDMMDCCGVGDHNCFSKFLLNWIDPNAVTAFGTAGFNLTPSGSDGAMSSVLVMPGFDPDQPFGEFFMVQNRYRTGNDFIGYPNDGLLVWHVDASLEADGQSFKYNNSNTARKLLRLMEADGLEEIGAGDGTVADAGDYYTDGDVFGPVTTPSSARYNGAATGITVDAISQSRAGEVYCEVGIAPAQGDLDGDGDVDAADLQLLAQVLAGNLDLTDPAQANMYFDALVNSADLIVGQQYLAGNIPAPYLAVSGSGTLYTTDSIVGNLMYVPAGTFTQGSPTDEPCRQSIETQFSHTLTRPLAVMQTEVTRQMWAVLLAAQPSLPADPTDITYGAGTSNPVQNNSWYEAVLFANLLSLQQGLTRCYYSDAGFTTPIDAANYTAGNYFCDFAASGYRLLTEGEWEYCCRAGTATPFWIAEPNYTSGNCGSSSPGLFAALETAAWFWDNSSALMASSPAGTKAANPWGLYDTHGNVWEWCWDWLSTYPSGAIADYEGATSGSGRVERGGGWDYGARYCRSADRRYFAPGARNRHLGFRLVRTIG